MATNNLTCGVSPVTDWGPRCSGNGLCLLDILQSPARGACFCDEGWQGESDFQVTNSKLDCQINILAIRCMWGVVLGIHLLAYLRYLPKLWWLVRKHRAVVQKNKQAGKKYTLWDNKGLLSLVPYVTVGWVSQTIFMCIKIADQNLKIGSSVVVTILYLLWRTTFYFCPDTFQPALVSSLLTSQRNLDHIIALNRHLSNFHMAISMLLGVLVVIPLIVPQDDFNPRVGIISAVMLYAGGSLSMGMLAIQAFYIERKVQAILVKSFELSKEQRTKRIMEKMAANQRQVIVTGGMNFIIYGLFACVPFLWNKHDYLLPFAWILVSVTISQVINSLVQEETSSSSTRGSVPEGSGDPSAPSRPSVPGSPPIQRPPPPESTVVGTIDVASVVEVDDEENPALLATGGKWTNAKVQSEGAQ